MLLVESDLNDDSNVLNEGHDDTYLPQGNIWDDYKDNDDSSEENEMTQSNNAQGQMMDDDNNALQWIPPEELEEELPG